MCIIKSDVTGVYCFAFAGYYGRRKTRSYTLLTQGVMTQECEFLVGVECAPPNRRALLRLCMGDRHSKSMHVCVYIQIMTGLIVILSTPFDGCIGKRKL
jgi:hypothetical protein